MTIDKYDNDVLTLKILYIYIYHFNYIDIFDIFDIFWFYKFFLMKTRLKLFHYV